MAIKEETEKIGINSEHDKAIKCLQLKLTNLVPVDPCRYKKMGWPLLNFDSKSSVSFLIKDFGRRCLKKKPPSNLYFLGLYENENLKKYTCLITLTMIQLFEKMNVKTDKCMHIIKLISSRHIKIHCNLPCSYCNLFIYIKVKIRNSS